MNGDTISDRVALFIADHWYRYRVPLRVWVKQRRWERFIARHLAAVEAGRRINGSGQP